MKLLKLCAYNLGRHSTSLHRASQNHYFGLQSNCYSSSAVRDANAIRRLSERRIDFDFNRNLSKLKWHANKLSSKETEGFNFKCSNHMLGYYAVFRHVSLSRKYMEVYQHKYVHTTSTLSRDESKVVETLEALKDTIKESATIVSRDVAGVTEKPNIQVAAPVAVKKSLRERVVAELKHYYHGFRLLFIDVKVCARLIWQVLNGRPLTRREQKQVFISW